MNRVASASALGLASAPCPLCGSIDRNTLLAGVPDLVGHTSGRWDLVACACCRLVTTSPPIPADEIHRYYSDDYSSFGNVTPQRSRLKAMLRSIMLAPYCLRFGRPERDRAPFGGARALDVGAGSGALLAMLSRRGWRCYCLEPSARAIERAQGAVPEAIFFHSTLEEFETDLSFDLIMLVHVLEHVRDPIAALAKLHRLLAPGGRLIIEVPNIGGTEARLFGRRWRGLDVPRHYTHFTPETLGKALVQTGFVVERQRTAFLASSITDSLVLIAEEFLGRDLRRARASRALYYAITPLASWSYLLGNVGALEITACRGEDAV